MKMGQGWSLDPYKKINYDSEGEKLYYDGVNINKKSIIQRTVFDLGNEELYQKGKNVTQNIGPCLCEGPALLVLSGCMLTAQVARTSIDVLQKGYSIGSAILRGPVESYHPKQD